jgi:hypothetical protein
MKWQVRGKKPGETVSMPLQPCLSVHPHGDSHPEAQNRKLGAVGTPLPGQCSSRRTAPGDLPR